MNFVRLHVIPVIAFLMTMLTYTIVQAENRPSLLMLGNIRQSADFSYSFGSNSFKNTSNTQHTFAEKYDISFDYAVATPRLLNGNIALQLEADQYETSGSTLGKGHDSNKLVYSIKASVIDKSPIPLTLLLQSQIQEVETPFMGSYLNNSNLYSATWALKNRELPIALNVLYSDSSTNGLQIDRQANHSEVSLYAQHNKGISRSNLNIKHTEDRFTFSNSTESYSNRFYGLDLDNALHWESGGKIRNLQSGLKLSEEAGNERNSTLYLNESLDWELGKALKSGLSYSHGSVSGTNTEQKTDSGSFWLNHRLYQSLDTRLQGNVRSVSFGTGSETEVNGKASLDYKKMLPSQSSMGLQTYGQYGETDRHSSGARRPLLEEPHLVSLGQTILLDNPNYLAGSILVRNENRAVRPQRYVEGVDFRVVQIGNQTEIVVSGVGLSTDIMDDSQLPNGNRLMISYLYQVDNDIRFSTTSFGLGGDVSLFNGQYRFYTRYNKYIQDALSQDASTQKLGYQTLYTAGFESRINKVYLSTAYTNNDGSFQNIQSIDGSVNYSDEWGTATTTLFLKNNYRWYGVIGGVQREPDDIISVGGTYRQPIFLNGLMTLATNYNRYMSTTASDQLSVSAQMNWNFRKMIVSLQSRAGLSRTGNYTSNTEFIRLHITRYF